MDFYTHFIKPSPSITAPELRLKAEIGTWLTIVRTFLLLAVLATVVSLGDTDKVMYGVVVLSFVSYGLSRTRFYRLAIWLIIIEPMIAITSLIVRTGGDSLISLAAPTALILAPLIASFVLSTRQTVAIVVATVICFIIMLFAVHEAAFPLVASELATNILVSGLAVLGSWLHARANREMNAVRAQFDHASRLAALGEMASGVAHELNTPLTSILLNAELAEEALKQPDAAGAVRNHLSEIADITQRMGTIISDLKDDSRSA